MMGTWRVSIVVVGLACVGLQQLEDSRPATTAVLFFCAHAVLPVRPFTLDPPSSAADSDAADSDEPGCNRKQSVRGIPVIKL